MSDRHYSERKFVRRQRSFEQHIAQRFNPVRFVVALPDGVNLEEIDWSPSWQEREWQRWLEAKKQYEAEWMADALKRMAQVTLIVEQDKRDLARTTKTESQKPEPGTWHWPLVPIPL